MESHEALEFTPEKFALFLTEYVQAEQDKAESFDFEGHAFLTSYAKYVVKYLLPKFQPESE